MALLCASIPYCSLQAWAGAQGSHPTTLQGPARPIPLTSTKLGGPQELETQENPRLRAPPPGAPRGRSLLIYKLPPCSLCSLNYCPATSLRGLESLQSWWLAPWFLFVFIINSCIYVKRSFLNICAFSLLARLSAAATCRAAGWGGQWWWVPCVFLPSGVWVRSE